MSKTNKIHYPSADRGEVIHPTPERWKRSELVPTVTYEDDADGGRRPVKTLRNTNASVTKRLARCKNLTAGQLMAASMFERDHETARLEPRLTCNLLGTGGGERPDMTAATLLARNRKHHALNALRLGGPEVVRVVEDVVLNANTVVEVGKTRHKNPNAANAWAGMALSAGLHLLEAHYRADGRIAGA